MTDEETRETERTDAAAALMDAYSKRTGLTSDAPDRRYLWTDAFAVRNFLALAAQSGRPEYVHLAHTLVTRVHGSLGRHRADDFRVGWLSGLPDEEGALHPTLGGLRIGKPLPERGLHEAFDPDLEWERDGQYFHYLTQWMCALDAITRETGRPEANLWARELGAVSLRAFRAPTGGRRLAWKMSIDLTRPLVTSTGQHDALDGLVTFAELRATASAAPGPTVGPDLVSELEVLWAMNRSRDWATDDPLGIGGLLGDAARIARLVSAGAIPHGDELLLDVLDAADAGLHHFARRFDPRSPPSRRLAFRELGLGIGLRAAQSAAGGIAGERPLETAFAAVLAQTDLARAIERFWMDPTPRSVASWTEHADINDVMLATLLLPQVMPASAP